MKSMPMLKSPLLRIIMYAGRLDKGCGTFLSDGLPHVGAVDALVAGCGADDTSGTYKAVKDGAEEFGFAPEVFVRAFAEVDDAWLVHFVGIAEDVFKAKQVDDGAVESPERIGHKFLVARHSIRDEADVGIGSHTDIGRVVAASCCCAGRV